MQALSTGLIIGISIGLLIGVLLALFIFFCIRYHRIISYKIGKTSSRREASIPIRANVDDNASVISNSSIGTESPMSSFERNDMSLWFGGGGGGVKKTNGITASGLLKYPYKELLKATLNFTTLIGQGSFGPVYRAEMSTGETVAVKVLATNSKQGEKQFQTEVLLLGRLHHRNLVNLIGYCAEKGQHILLYIYMSEKCKPLSWDLRVQIALDVARGLEYLHDGAIPPVIHRDIKSSNILLDASMRARVADFGLSREEMVNRRLSNVRGTFGYLDPEYVSTNTFTTQSDIYSFGVLLFELIAGRNPQQGLMEYVELAAMNVEGKVCWEEIVDSRLDGKFCSQELNAIAVLAYKCVSQASKDRPSMRDIVPILLHVINLTNEIEHHKQLSSSTTTNNDIIVTINDDKSEQQQR
ncbi:calcium/calmodulin-regulated receptor-like kinase 1 isoform X2 [Impatiens glandulifera]|uniref:calcium/calmodulin-regulated receptor-like kinase 1 isoform X2 n=1 Tax=Impatiens glandulifera TaxID=253017 RepID=UPI001FB0B505|nr:calcium/calmodulin-regulated receptor-like kinase 1 isoform X2 [Impatiens glandulifera]